jgi:polyisoprenoid-binding protein YceI
MGWSMDPMHTQVEFSAKHMGIMTVKGAFTDVSAAIDFNQDDFTASSVAAAPDAAEARTIEPVMILRT